MSIDDSGDIALKMAQSEYAIEQVGPYMRDHPESTNWHQALALAAKSLSSP